MDINLPFEIKDIVYTTDWDEFENTIVKEEKIKSVEIEEFGITVWTTDIREENNSFVYPDDWENCYFSTRQEAEEYIREVVK